MRDFLVLHYWANGREGEPFWDAMRALGPPATLKCKIDQWRDTGHIHREHEELFTEVAWFQVFAGQGVSANHYNPLADAMAEQDLRDFLASQERALEQAAAAMPHHADTLGRLMARPAKRNTAA